jgi:inositol-pentakisphosphate 2-kinase
MKVSDWVYIGEGGKHVVFAYIGSNASEYKNKVWRMPKELISNGERKVSKEPCSRSVFQSAITRWIFGAYMDIPETISMGYEFVRELCSEAMTKGKIPNSRLKDWNIFCISDSLDKRMLTNLPSSIPGMLLPNYQDKSFAFSVELKPKAGYLPSSILVHPERRFKYYLSRFQILQKLNHDGILEKGWNKGACLEQISQYDPLDLFSGEKQRIRRAILALFACPQNNLKVYTSGNLILSHDVMDLNGFHRGFEMMGAIDSDPDEVVSELQKNLVTILHESLFLNTLGSFQKKFDILDLDGAILIYDHLLFLCNGETDKAEHLIDDEYQDIVHKIQNGDLDQQSFVKMNSIQLHHAMGTRSNEYNTLIEELGRDFDSNLLNEKYEYARTLVKHLNEYDCARLLGNWLISQALVDLSFFVCIQKSSSKGIIHYEIKVVDYDSKPSKKLRNKAIFEQKLSICRDKFHQVMNETTS